MSCTNCFNGCAETISDKCIRYTGETVPFLEIINGEPLVSVEQKITTYLSSVYNGTGIYPQIEPSIICELVSENISCQGCTTLTLEMILTALIKSVCQLQNQIDDISGSLANLNSPYTTDCITVVNSSDTHEVLQAVIDEVCKLGIDVGVISNSLSLYVKTTEINNLIAAYLNGLNSGSSDDKHYKKMVPYVAYEYYGSLANFDVEGRGITGTEWEKVYLCIGKNGTPDRRGVVAAGAVDQFSENLRPEVNPIQPNNPPHSLNVVVGANSYQLIESNLPSHTHSAVAEVNDPGHQHGYLINGGNPGQWGPSANDRDRPTINTDTAKTDITVDVTIGTTGSGVPYKVTQPTIGCNFIMYIP